MTTKIRSTLVATTILTVALAFAVPHATAQAPAPPAPPPASSPPPPASMSGAEGPSHQGFTLQLSLGGGAAVLTGNGQSSTQAGIGGLNLALGGFVSPKLALLGSIQGVNYTPSTSFSLAIAYTVAFAAQYWINEWVNLVGGAGIGFVVNQLSGTAGNISITVEARKAGLGLQLGANAMFLRRKHHSLGVGFMFAPIIGSDLSAYTLQGVLAYQFH